MSQYTFISAIDTIESINVGIIGSVDHLFFYNFKFNMHIDFSFYKIS